MDNIILEDTEREYRIPTNLRPGVMSTCWKGKSIQDMIESEVPATDLVDFLQEISDILLYRMPVFVDIADKTLLYKQIVTECKAWQYDQVLRRFSLSRLRG